MQSEPRGASGNALNAIAVVSASDAWAVGDYSDPASGKQHTLAEQWNGSAWSVVPSPGQGFLNGVAAVSASDDWAVGYSIDPTTGNYQTLVEQWNGSTWSIVPSPSPNVGTGTNVLTGVGAVSGADVWAVGANGLIEHWNGSTWAVVPNPASGQLSAIAAVSATDVWAVGGGGSEGTLTEQWNGVSWNVIPSPGITPYIDSLIGVAVVSATDIWAVGSYQLGAGAPQQMLTEQWNGSTWSIVPSPSSSQYAQLYGAAADLTGGVWVVGFSSAFALGQNVVSTLIASHS